MIAIAITIAVDVVTFGGLFVAVWLIGERPFGSAAGLLPPLTPILVGGAALAAASLALGLIRKRRIAFVLAALLGAVTVVIGSSALTAIASTGAFGRSTLVDGFVLITTLHLLHVVVLVALFARAALKPPSGPGDRALSWAWHAIALLYIPLVWTFAS